MKLKDSPGYEAAVDIFEHTVVVVAALFSWGIIHLAISHIVPDGPFKTVLHAMDGIVLIVIAALYAEYLIRKVWRRTRNGSADCLVVA